MTLEGVAIASSGGMRDDKIERGRARKGLPTVPIIEGSDEDESVERDEVESVEGGNACGDEDESVEGGTVANKLSSAADESPE